MYYTFLFWQVKFLFEPYKYHIIEAAYFSGKILGGGSRTRTYSPGFGDLWFTS